MNTKEVNMCPILQIERYELIRTTFARSDCYSGKREAFSAINHGWPEGFQGQRVALKIKTSNFAHSEKNITDKEADLSNKLRMSEQPNGDRVLRHTSIMMLVSAGMLMVNPIMC